MILRDGLAIPTKKLKAKSMINFDYFVFFLKKKNVFQLHRHLQYVILIQIFSIFNCTGLYQRRSFNLVFPFLRWNWQFKSMTRIIFFRFGPIPFNLLRIFEVFWVKDHSALLTTHYGKLQQKEYSQHGFHRYFSALRIKHCIDCVMLSYFWNKGFHKDLIIYAVGNFAWELWKRLREVII